MRVGVIFVDIVWNLSYNYASYVDLRTRSPVCGVVDSLVNPVMPMMQTTVKSITYSWRWYLVEILQRGHVFSDPFVPFPPIMPMVCFRIVMPAYHRQRTHKFLSWSLLRWLFTLLLHAKIFALSFVALVALCQPCLCLRRVMFLSKS